MQQAREDKLLRKNLRGKYMPEEKIIIANLSIYLAVMRQNLTDEFGCPVEVRFYVLETNFKSNKEKFCGQKSQLQSKVINKTHLNDCKSEIH